MHDTVDSGEAEAFPGTGELIAGRYRIMRWLGAGGMGSVYRVFDTELGETVALKMLHRGLSVQALDRFRREVKLTRRVVHRNVARVFDIGEHASDRFLTMELVDGQPLSRVLSSGLLGWPEILGIAGDICSGLSAIHHSGGIHRHLKPANVLIADGRAVVSDFGIARATDDMGTTQQGTIVGTPNYMAPEQIEGTADARSDLFSLGVVLFELATGQRPWEATTPLALALAITTKPPRRLRDFRPDVPPAYSTLVEQCLQADPARRPANAAQIGTTLAGIQAGPATRPSVPALELVDERATTISVAPFEHAAADAHLVRELIDEIVDALARRRGLRIRIAKPGEPRDAVGIDHVIEGEIRRLGDRELRVVVRLVHASDGFQIWSDRLLCTERDLLLAPHAITNGIVTALSRRPSAAPRPADPRAAELYVQARGELRRFWGNHVTNAVALLEEAAALAPESAPILATLALASVRVWVMREGPGRGELARQALARACAIDPEHRETRLAIALHRMNIGEMTSAAAELGAALARAPMSADAHENVGRILLELGEIEDGRARLVTSIGLDPGRRPVILTELARVDALLGDDAAAAQHLQALAFDPDPSLRQLGAIFSTRLAGWRGELAAFDRLLEQLAGREGETVYTSIVFITRLIRGEITDREWDAHLAHALADHRPRRVQLVWAQLLAEVESQLGRDERTLSLIRWAIEHGLFDVVWMTRCPPIVALADRMPRAFAPLEGGVRARAADMLAAFRGGLTGG